MVVLRKRWPRLCLSPKCVARCLSPTCVADEIGPLGSCPTSPERGKAPQALETVCKYRFEFQSPERGKAPQALETLQIYFASPMVNDRLHVFIRYNVFC